MKKDKLKELPTEKLIKKKKFMGKLIYFLIVLLSLRIIYTIWLFKAGRFDGTQLVSPILLTICLLSCLNTKKNMREELSSRDFEELT